MLDWGVRAAILCHSRKSTDEPPHHNPGLLYDSSSRHIVSQAGITLILHDEIGMRFLQADQRAATTRLDSRGPGLVPPCFLI